MVQRTVKFYDLMKIIYILRHAKSSWDDATMTDFERPLNQRGLKTAPFIGKLMKERGLVPDVILSSPAKRACETAKLVCESAGFETQIKLDQRIYEATVGTLVSIVMEIDDSFDSALLVGHNPGAEGLVYYLTGEIAPMPTAALAVIELKINNWADISNGRGSLRFVFRPREEIS